MEKLQIYSQCWSRTQHKPWGLWGRQQRPKGSLQHYSASFCGPQHVLHSACATPRTRERAHAPNYHAKPSPVLCTGEHSSACTLILRSGPDKGRERAHTHAPTRWKTQGFMDWWCLSGKNHPTPPPPSPGTGKTSNVSVQFCDFTPFRNSSSEKQEEKLTFLVSPWLFLLCGIL